MKNFLLVIALVVFIFSCKTNKSKTEDKPLTIQKVNDLPSMPLAIKGQSPKSARELTDNTILIFYQPDCDHCQREAKEISDSLEHFNNYSLYFTTTEGFEAIDKFAIDYNLSGKDNVFFAQTTLDAILNTVGPISAPSVFIYRDQRLVKHLDGETSVSEIIKYL